MLFEDSERLNLISFDGRKKIKEKNKSRLVVRRKIIFYFSYNQNVLIKFIGAIEVFVNFMKIFLPRNFFKRVLKFDN